MLGSAENMQPLIVLLGFCYFKIGKKSENDISAF